MVKIINIIPITKGCFKDELSYFGTGSYNPGELVEIELKNRKIKGLVTSTKSIKEMKSELRQADFTLKKITKNKSISFCRPNFFLAVEQIAEYFCAPRGQILKSLIPSIILDNLEILPQNKDNAPQTEMRFKNEPFIIQESDKDRLSIYKGLIRECFAQKQSVFLSIPNISSISFYKDFLEKGIEKHTFILHSRMKKEDIIKNYQKILSAEHPVLIIATPSYISLPRKDIKTIIIEKESSDNYKEIARPFLDYRLVAQFISQQEKIRLIFGDSALRTETIYYLAKKEYQPLFPPKYRSLSSAQQILIDLTQEENKKTPLSQELIRVIEKVREKNSKLLILNNQRGFVSAIYCQDCGNIFKCSNCSSPLIIHEENKNRRLLCHKCLREYPIKDSCPVCSGWRLELLGSGVDKISTLLEELIPASQIFRISSDYTKTPQQTEKVINKFLKQKTAVLVGTELALNYIHEKIDYVAITSLDNILAIPDFRSSEKVLNIMLKAKNLANKIFLVQTRNSEEKAFEAVIKGNLLDFYREETIQRKNLNYPPFKTLIKITINGDKCIDKQLEELNRILTKWQPLTYPAFNFIIKKKERWNILLKLSPEQWPDLELLNILKNLPPNYIINIEPQDIL